MVLYHLDASLLRLARCLDPATPGFVSSLCPTVSELGRWTSRAVWKHANALRRSAFETLACIFWLATWATLARDAATIQPTRYYVVAGVVASGNSYYIDNITPHWIEAIQCLRASAVLGALEWVLFCISLGCFGTSPPTTRYPRRGRATG